MLNREDAVEAMAYYIASYLSKVPEAQQLNPIELQKALGSTFQVSHSVKPLMAVTAGKAADNLLHGLFGLRCNCSASCLTLHHRKARRKNI